MRHCIRFGIVSAALALALLGAREPVMLHAQQAGAAPVRDLEVLQVRPNFYMIGGAGSNIAVHVGDDGVIVVDAGSGARSEGVLAAIRRITPGEIRYVINTNGDADHVGGNKAIAGAGVTLLTNRSFGLPADFASTAAVVLATEAVLTRMSAAPAPGYPQEALPTETFFYPRKYMFLNGEGIELLQQPAAHTDGDAVVFFRRSDVIVAGDVLDTTRFPVIDLARGGSVDGVIAALNRLVDLAIPSVPLVSREMGTVIIPGHGRVCDQLDVVDYRDMVTIVRDRVQALIKAGKTLAEVEASNPTRGYTARYGATTGSWTTSQFVEAVYRSLKPA